MRILVLASMLATAAIGPSIQHFSIDEARSDVSAQVGFLGITSKTVRFPDVAGNVTLVRERPEEAAINIVLDARKLTASDESTLAELRGEHFFWVDKYPTLTFAGEGLAMGDATHGTASGELTVRGVTQPVLVELAFDQPPLESVRGQPLTLTGSTTIRRQDFGMTAYRNLVGSKVDITIRMSMIPQ